jgi:SAM-dependent methyltransferase
MFAPRPDVVTKELLRVLKPGGRLAFATWPAEHFVGRSLLLAAKYLPPPPPGVSAPVLWGDVNVVRERLGSAVTELEFERGAMLVPALSPQHLMAWQSEKIGPSIKTRSILKKEPEKLDAFLREYQALVEKYLVDNVLRQEYLLTRAIKNG